MNYGMWIKALRVIPRVSAEEWRALDVISKWLISTRAAVLVMTFLSSAIAGVFAYQNHQFDLTLWLLVTFGLIFAHATNNLLNDFTDWYLGVDFNNYYRAQYGPQPLVHGLMSKLEFFLYILVTGSIALACGLALAYLRGGMTLALMLSGAFFVLFYTWPLKYIGLGEVAVLLVWGPLMIGGAYYVLTASWSWTVVAASMPYALGVTGVIFGKHIDKIEMDSKKKIFTLPVILGEKLSRKFVLAMLALQYVFVILLVLTRFFSPILLVVFLAARTFLKVVPIFQAVKPIQPPKEFEKVWPNYFVAAAFIHNRDFGGAFLMGLLSSAVMSAFTA